MTELVVKMDLALLISSKIGPKISMSSINKHMKHLYNENSTINPFIIFIYHKIIC